jgi:signal transduction histidine kinase
MTFSLTAPDEDRTILADSALILRVCENLASNAVRFAVQEVSAEIRLTDDRLFLTVADDGAGFSEEALQKADRPFYRGDKDSNQHFGLGLYICRLLCMKCGGGLTLANGENGGGKVTASFQI